MHGAGTGWLLHGVVEYQRAGIGVIGYLTAGYEGRRSGGDLESRWYNLETGKRLVLNMSKYDKVDGVFIDECSAFPGPRSKKYLRELTALAHRLKMLAWGNVGQETFDPWYLTEGGFDFMHSTEHWYGQEMGPVQQEWAPRITVAGARRDFTAADAVRLTVNAWRKGIAYCYISDRDYATLPSWFETYIAGLRAARLES